MMMSQMTGEGHHGDPGLASHERGEALIEVKTNALVEFLEDVKNNQVEYRQLGTLKDGNEKDE